MSTQTLVESFFADKLPLLIAARADAFNAQSGALAIVVEGAGSWTITFGDAGSDDVIIDDVDVDADCIAVWTVAGFTDILKGGATRPSAIVGDEKLLSRLGTLMLPAQRGVLGARLAAFAA